ncbi:MAG: isopeptide-forming domain-containing fimbrial protein, partial [Acidimicrobiia bacterium]|nr:isopeptide-forming domain-containing fimbrial protein [Acidimicrobiia bacterium]
MHPSQRRRLLIALAAAVVLAGFLPWPGSPFNPGPADAGANDNFSLSKADDVGGEALIGEHVTYTLTATGTQASAANLYNLSFRDVLPAGVEFVSASPAPTAVLTDTPLIGQTTVIWENVSDLPAASQSSVTVTVDTNPDFAGGNTGSTTVPVGPTITNTSQAVASLDAFAVPDWDAGTGQFTADFDGSANASDAVEIIPFRVTRTAPRELLRGVHQNGFDGGSGTVGAPFTIVVENNPDYAVAGVTLVDTIDPALEFLGCDTYYPADNTTVGEEWTGSGPVATGTGCAPTPSAVSTSVAGETIVTWGLGDFNPGDAATVTYHAGIPLLANAPFTGTPPTAASLGQGRNLDNNTGPSTGEPDRTPGSDPELLTAPEPQLDNLAIATGVYLPTGATDNDTGSVVIESEDLVIGKSMTGTLVRGSTVVTTLTITTSEYRDVSNLVVRDLLPSGLCFLGTYNVDNTSGGSDWSTNDCPGAGTMQSTIDGTPVDVAEVRELPDGGPYGTGRLELVWDFSDPDNAALADLDADGTLTISYGAVVREYYRGGLAQLTGEPVLSGDRVTNEAEVSGPDTVADVSLPADGVDPDGGPDGDTASASIANGFPTINKRIAVKTGPVADGANITAGTCGTSHGAITWTDANPTPELGYGPGDIICVELGASFPSNVTYEGVTIQDLVPPGLAYVNGSATRISSIDTVAGTTVTESPGVVTFSLDGSGVVSPAGNEFRWVIAVQASGTGDGAANDITANLQKLVHNNNGGKVFQLRDQAEAEWTEPEVRLAKGIDTVNGGSSNGPDFDGSLGGGSTAVTAAGSDVVTYRIDVWNVGNKAATSTEIQDVLPTGLACSDVSAISDAGSCSSGRITWTGLTVPASTGGGDLTPDDHTTAPITLTYDLTIPADVDPANTWVNTAGVASYEAVTNTASVQAYYPTDNIDPANALLENTDAADDESYLATPAPGVTTLVRSAIDEAGNAGNPALAATDDEATIGEIVQYEVILTIPEGTTVYDGVVTDTLPAGLTYFTGNGLFAGTVSNLQPTVTSPTSSTSLTLGTLSHSGGVVTYTLPTPYTNAGGSGDDQVAITFYAQVEDVVGNAADPTATRFANSATFDYDDNNGSARPSVSSAAVNVDVVEPNPAIVKDHTAPAGTQASPGDAITYRITIDNPASANNVSAAHDVTVVDTVPVGLTPLGPGAVPVGSDGDTVASSGVTPTGSFTGTWSETNRTITWTPTDITALDTVDPGTTVQFTYDVEVDDPAIAAGSLTNAAALTAFSLDQDLSPVDDPNEADARSYSSSDDDTIGLPLASIAKDVEPFNGADPNDDRSGATVGEPVDYELSVTVPSGVVAYDATIFDDLPTSLDFDSFGSMTIGTECEVFDAGTGSTTGTSLTAGAVETFSPVGVDAQLAAWFLGDIYANGACTIDVRYTAHVNTTAVTGDTVTNDGLLAWNGSDAVASQTPAALPANYDDPDSASWTATSDPAAETVGVVEPALEIDEDVRTIAGAALANPICDIIPGNHDGTSDDADGAAPDGCDTSAGAQLRYTVTVSNVGSSSAHDATVVEAVPAGLTPLASPGGSPVTADGQTVTGSTASVGTWSETNHTITWTLTGPITPAGAVTVDYDVQVDASAGLTRGLDLSATADVPLYHGLPSTERTQILIDNPANDDLVIYGNDVSATRGSLTPDQVTVEVHFPTLTVAKAAAGGQDVTDARLDTSFTWTITVTNTDAVAPAFGIDVVDQLPEGWTYDTGSAQVTTPHNGGPVQVEPSCAASPSGSCATAADLNTETLTWTDLVSGSGEPLAPGETITIELTATPQSAALASSPAIGESFTGHIGGTGFAHSNDVTVTGEDATGSTICCDPDGPGGMDPETYTASDDDEVFIARADIEVTKTISPLEGDADPDNGPYWFGSFVDYTVTVDNEGPDQATGVTIADVLDPTELDFDSVTSVGQGSFDDTTNIWTVGTLANGASATLVLRTRLVALGSVTNVAQNQTTDQYDADSSPGNDLPTEDDQGSVAIEVVPSSLGDYVWLDLDGDGTQDPSEPGIPGVQLDLTWNDPGTGSPMSYSAVTGSDGSYGVPTAVGLPADTDITVTVDTAASPNLTGLSPSWDRDLTPDGTTTEQVTTGDTTLPDGTLADLGFDFGYNTSATQTLGNKLWWDVDGSGDASGGAGEPGIPGVTITATWAGWDGIAETADDITFTESTDPTGAYLFTNLPPGDYVVTVTTAELPTGLDIETYDLDGLGGSSADSAEITLDPSENQLDVDFSYRGTGTIGETIWFDHDGDGTVDGGEPGLGGVAVTATWDGPDGIAGNADDIALATTTAPDGTYSLANLPIGAFVVTVDDTTLPGNLGPTFDDDGVGTAHTSTIDLTTAAPSDTDQDFGYRGAGSIGDTVFYDVDGAESDGTPDPGDSAIPGVDVTVQWAGADDTFGTADDFSSTDTTDGTGRYLVTELAHGQYRITVDESDLPAGLDAATYDQDGTGTAGRSDTTLGTASPDDADQDFAYTGASSGVIGDRVWFDADGDGVEDTGEVGFSGVGLTLTWYGPNGTFGGGDDVVQLTTTGPSGAYEFDNLPDGTYRVAVDDTTLPAGLAPTHDDDGTTSAHRSEITISPGHPFDREQDFGYTGVGSIGDLVWFDVDDSGTSTANAGEPGIAGVDLVVVWDNPQGSDVTYTVSTGDDGDYLVPRLPHGDYTVSVQTATLPGGLTPTHDPDGIGTADTTVVTLTSAAPDVGDRDFSYTGVGSIGDTVWFDENANGTADPVGSGVFDGEDQALAGIGITVTWGGFDGVVGDDEASPSVDES